VNLAWHALRPDARPPPYHYTDPAIERKHHDTGLAWSDYGCERAGIRTKESGSLGAHSFRHVLQQNARHVSKEGLE